MNTRSRNSIVMCFSIVAVISLITGFIYYWNSSHEEFQPISSKQSKEPSKTEKLDLDKADANTKISVIRLNNLGVRELNSRNFAKAISLFSRALKADPSYSLARMNLAIAYNNLGLQKQDSPLEALKNFHRALILNPDNSITQSNIEGIIHVMSRNPNNFPDRVEIAEKALAIGDRVTAAGEYRAALQIKEDPKIRKKYEEINSKSVNFN